VSQFNVLEKKYSQTEFQNKTLENSKELLEKEINELKSTIKLQTNISKNEIKKLNLKIERRDKKIEKIKETLDEANKKLQMIQEKESPIEKTSQKINETLKETEQDKHIIKSKNLIERIARW
jgi:chromosome segregation ATPase